MDAFLLACFTKNRLRAKRIKMLQMQYHEIRSEKTKANNILCEKFKCNRFKNIFIALHTDSVQ